MCVLEEGEEGVKKSVQSKEGYENHLGEVRVEPQSLRNGVMLSSDSHAFLFPFLAGIWKSYKIPEAFSDPVRAKSLQWCLTLLDPMYCSPLDSSVHGFLQASILERISVPYSRGSSGPRV